MTDGETTLCDVDRGAEDAVAVLEGRARCVEDVLQELGVGITTFAQDRDGLEWVGSAQLQFTWAADELLGELRSAASALDEAIRTARGAVSDAMAGSAG